MQARRFASVSTLAGATRGQSAIFHTYQQQFGMIYDWIKVLGVRHAALGTNAKIRIG